MSIEAVLIMSQDENGSPRPRRRAQKPATKPGKGDAAFNLWLDRGLHSLFDDVANEPVPDELLRMIEEDRLK